MFVEVVAAFYMLTLCTTVNSYYIPQTYNSQYTIKPASSPRLTLEEWPSYNIQNPYGPGTYAYGYEVDDPITGNKQFKNEEKFFNNTVKGSYGLLRPDGMISITSYVSDENGYRSTVEQKHSPPNPQQSYESHIRPSSNYPVALPLYTEDAVFIPQQMPLGRQQPLPQFQYKSPILMKQVQPVYGDDELNGFILHNSKLNNFFMSPYYFDNIRTEHADLKQNLNVNDDDYDTIDVHDSVLPGLSSPLTKESIWYKEYINTKYKQ